MANVSYRRRESARLMPIWRMIRDVIDGPTAIKAAGDLYLPRPNASDDSNENRERYKAYLKRAVFYDATSQTHRGLVGQIFHRDPVISLSGPLSHLLESADGGELTLVQQSKDACGTALSLGHCGILTDYPNVSEASMLDISTGRIRPTIILYQPEQILNWRWTYRNGSKTLSLLVLEERYDCEDDGFEAKVENQWRVLSLVPYDEDDPDSPLIYKVEIYRENEGMSLEEEYYPLRGDGTHWDTITFSFIGSENNDPIPDKPPLEGMAHINLGHYRNSADYEESCFMVGQPTPYATGLTSEWIEEVWKGELRLGSVSIVPLPAGGSCGLIQSNENQMPKAAMDHKERQMVALGAKLIEQAQVQRTATEASNENMVENSILSSVAKNVTAAYKQSIQYSSEYLGIKQEFEFELNTDFEVSRLNPQERQQLLSEWQSGGITWEEYRWNLKRSGIASEDDEEAKSKIENERSSQGGSMEEILRKALNNKEEED